MHHGYIAAGKKTASYQPAKKLLAKVTIPTIILHFLTSRPYAGAGVPPALPGVSTPFASVAALFLFFFFGFGTTAGFRP